MAFGLSPGISPGIKNRGSFPSISSFPFPGREIPSYISTRVGAGSGEPAGIRVGSGNRVGSGWTKVPPGSRRDAKVPKLLKIEDFKLY